MKTIYRYEIPFPSDVTTVTMPKDAEIIHMQWWKNSLSIWAIVQDPEYGLEERYFVIYGTGHDMSDENEKFIGSFPYGSELIFHVFEKLN